MRSAPRRSRAGALGLLLLAAQVACTVTGDGYVGVAYETGDYDYGGWGPTYYVAPPRGREHREERRDEHREERNVERRPEPPPAPRAYRPAPPSRPAPSIPTRPAPSRRDRR